MRATFEAPQTAASPIPGNAMVHVLIPAHNNKREVLTLLQCLHCQRGQELTVVLVDDGSVDGTCEMVRRRFPSVTVLHGDGNLWWTGANVLGVSHIMDSAGDNRKSVV